VAIEVKEQMNLHRVELIPALNPPHKLDKEILDFDLRVMLLKKSIEGLSFLKVNTIERHRSGPSYTVDTLKELSQLYLNDELFFVIGGDEIPFLNKWYRWRKLFSLAHFVVVGRREKDWIDLKRFINFNFSEAEESSPSSWCISHKMIYYINIPRLEISSSMIREKAISGKSLRGLVPRAIEGDIYRLYGQKKSFHK
jgi:nicotinate-nucleotide adenylyltransferase